MIIPTYSVVFIAIVLAIVVGRIGTLLRQGYEYERYTKR